MKKSISILLILLTTKLCAQWGTDPAVNTAVSVATNDQRTPKIASDGNNGGIIIWEDSRNGVNFQLYAQRINAAGTVQWATNGVILCSGGIEQFHAKIISDGSGGAIIVFEDARNGFNNDLYAQRIDGNGNVLWTTDGVAVCTAAGFQYYPDMISDGNGGAIITWYDGRSGNSKIYVQHIDSNGVAQWALNGVSISTNPDRQEYPKLISDGSNGAIITWRDRGSPGIQYRINSQRINSSGVTQWAATGNTVCTNTSDPAVLPDIAPDGNGGAIITWEDYRSLVYHIYAQHMGSNGVNQWIQDGVLICNAAGGQLNPKIITDGSNGAIITWNDERSGNGQVYAQRINAAGTSQWINDGIMICALVNNQYFTPLISSDNSNGAVIAWTDFRGADANIYAQHVDGSGAAQWAINGTFITAASNNQAAPDILYNSNGTSISAWTDFRGADADIYATRLLSDGSLPLTILSFTAQKNSNGVMLDWTTANELNTKYFDIEKSEDGSSFTSIGKVDAGINSNGQYHFPDRQLPNRLTYYRLKIVDADGKSRYSAVIRVNANIKSINIYPNPAAGSATVEWPGKTGIKLQVSIHNNHGQLLKQFSVAATTQIQLNVPGLANGTYVVSISGGKNYYTQQLIIQH